MSEREIFQTLGFTEKEYRGQKVYEGPNHVYYNLIDKDSYWIMRTQQESDEEDAKPNDRLKLFRIWPDEEFDYVVMHTILRHLRIGDEIYKPSVIFPEIAKMVREAASKKLTEDNIHNLIALYDAGVKAGNNGFIISDTCKEVLKMLTIHEDEYVSPELHKMLLKVSDVYYDFLIDAETVLANKPEMQERIISNLKRFPDNTTTELMIYLAAIGENIDISDEAAQRLIKLYVKDKVFKNIHMEDEANEMTMSVGNKDWKITSFTVSNTNYLLKHAGPIFFVYYLNQCIGGTSILKIDDETAQILHHNVNNEFLYPGVKDHILNYTERVVASAGMTRIVINSRNGYEDYYQAHGYQLDTKGEFHFQKGSALFKELPQKN